MVQYLYHMETYNLVEGPRVTISVSRVSDVWGEPIVVFSREFDVPPLGEEDPHSRRVRDLLVQLAEYF